MPVGGRQRQRGQKVGRGDGGEDIAARVSGLTCFSVGAQFKIILSLAGGIVLLPRVWGINGVWLAVPVAEGVMFAVSVLCLLAYQRNGTRRRSFGYFESQSGKAAGEDPHGAHAEGNRPNRRHSQSQQQPKGDHPQGK